MTYDKNFIQQCEQLYHMMKQNRSLKECLNANEEIASSINNNNKYEPLWFIYYMFFAIHNPKMEEYIQKKTQHNPPHNPQTPHIIKNMIRRRNYTSTIVFQLYTHAYTNDGNVTYIYPKDKDNALIKSYQSNHLKTATVHLRRHFTATAAATPAVVAFVEYMITTKSTYSTVITPNDVLNKINNNINYNNKDVILLALLCYMKLDEEDINQKNIFIAATTEEMNQEHDATTSNASNEPEIPSTSPSPYDEKYKYLYT